MSDGLPHSANVVKGLASWPPKTSPEERNFFGLSREVTPLQLAMSLRALGERPPWWRPFKRARWSREFFSIVNWWLMGCSAVYR